MKEKLEFELDKYVSMLVEFKNGGMLLHIADRNYGLKWYPNKKAIKNLIDSLQKIYDKMDDSTNPEEEDE